MTEKQMLRIAYELAKLFLEDAVKDGKRVAMGSDAPLLASDIQQAIEGYLEDLPEEGKGMEDR